MSHIHTSKHAHTKRNAKTCLIFFSLQTNNHLVQKITLGNRLTKLTPSRRNLDFIHLIYIQYCSIGEWVNKIIFFLHFPLGRVDFAGLPNAGARARAIFVC